MHAFGKINHVVFLLLFFFGAEKKKNKVWKPQFWQLQELHNVTVKTVFLHRSTRLKP